MLLGLPTLFHSVPIGVFPPTKCLPELWMVQVVDQGGTLFGGCCFLKVVRPAVDERLLYRGPSLETQLLHIVRTQLSASASVT